MTPARLTAILLVDCGVEDETLAPAAFVALAKARIVDDINAVLQKIYGKSPNLVSQTPLGAALAAPATLSGLTLTNGSTTFGGAVPSAAQIGCTILIAGEEFKKQIFRSLQPHLSATTLLYPFAGTTGTYDATVWTDLVHVPSADMILPPVGILGGNDLLPMQSAATFGQPTRFYGSDHGIQRDVPYGGFTQAGYGRSENRDIGTPSRYFVEQERGVTSGQITLAVRVDPMPDKYYTLRLTLKASAYQITSADDTNPVLMPSGTPESVLIPLCRAEFSTFKHFSTDQRGNAMAAAKDAWATLGTMTDVRGGYAQHLRVGEHW